jgi:serine/threonine protein kinase/WD40 repeat protein
VNDSKATLGFGEAPSGPAPPRRFGDYELLEEIARGGMGVVFRARQVSVGRVVALKMILAGQLASEIGIQRFQAEVHAAAKLDHPHIVPLYEVGAHDGQHYFTMKLIEGGKLQAASEAWRVESESQQRAAARLVATVARAVHYAHQRGILHRDLKPAIILLDAAGQPHITDFGLAKHVGEGAGTTVSGAVVGTPSYMPPEQAAARKDLTTAVDVYSLGAILYELLTGKAPFLGATALETLMQVMETEPVAPSKIGMRIDRDLETICLKCLEKTPERRYDSAEALAAELERWLRGEPILARPVSRRERLWRWCKRNPGVAALLAGIAALLIAGTVVASLAAIHFNALADDAQEARNNEKAAREQSELAEKAAKASALESKRRLVRQYSASAAKLMDKGDLRLALPWCVEALALCAGDPEQELLQRVRIGAILKQCPPLAAVLQHSHPVSWASFTDDGKRIMTTTLTKDGAEHRLWDRATFTPLGPSLSANQDWSEFSANGLMLALWNKNVVTVLDTQTGKPIVEFNNVFDASMPPGLTAPEKAAPEDAGGVVSMATFTVDNKRLVTQAGFQPARFVPVEAAARAWDAVAGIAPQVSGALLPAFSEIRVWDLVSKQAIGPALRFSGRTLVLPQQNDIDRWLVATSTDDLKGRANPDKRLHVWEGSTLQLKGEISIASAASPLHVRGDGNALSLLDSSGHAQIQRLQNGKPLGKPLQLRGKPTALEFHPFRSSVLVTGAKQDIRLVSPGTDLEDIQILEQGRGTDSVPVNGYSARFSLDGRYVFTPNGRDAAMVWDVERRRAAWPQFHHGATISGSDISPDGRWFMTYGEDGRVLVWDLARPLPYAPLPPEPKSVEPKWTQLPPGPDGKIQYALRLWNSERDEPETGNLLVADTFHDFAWSADRKQLAMTSSSVGSDLEVHLLDAGGQRRFPAISVPGTGLTSFSVFTPDGRNLVLQFKDTDNDGTYYSVELIDTATGKRHPLVSNWDRNLVVALSPDGQRLATLADLDDEGKLQQVTLWNTRTKQAIGPSLKIPAALESFDTEHGQCVFTKTMVENNALVCHLTVVDTNSGAVKMAQGAGGKARLTTKVPLQELSVTFRRDGRRFVFEGHRQTGGRLDPTLQLWDAERAEPMAPLLSGSLLAFMAQGDGLLVKRGDTVRVINGITGKPLSPHITAALADNTQPNPHQQNLSPDGRLAVLQLASGGCALYELSSGEPLTPALEPPLPGAEAPLLQIEGTRWRIKYGGTWDVSPTALPMEELRRLAVVLSCHEVDETGSLAAVEPEKFQAAWQALTAKPPAQWRASAGEALAWHQREAETCVRSEAWEAAVYHLDVLMAAEPTKWQHHAAHGRAKAGLEKWPEARKSLDKAVALGADDVSTLQSLPLVCLAQRDEPAYRAACAQLMEKFGSSESLRKLEAMALACTAVAKSGFDPQRLLVQIDKAVRSGGATTYDSLCATAATHLRAGQQDQAKYLLLGAVKQRARPVLAWLYLALTKSPTDRAGAVETFGSAAAALDDPDFALETLWEDLIVMRTLRHEVEAALAIEKK